MVNAKAVAFVKTQIRNGSLAGIDSSLHFAIANPTVKGTNLNKRRWTANMTAALATSILQPYLSFDRPIEHFLRYSQLDTGPTPASDLPRSMAAARLVYMLL
jgi:hypothetical protein